MSYLSSLSNTQRLLVLVAGLFLFVLPMPHSVSVRLTTLFIAAVVSIVIVRTRPLPPLPLKIPFIIWLALALLSLVWAVNPAYSAGEIKNEIIYTLLAFFVFFSQTRNEMDFQWWMRWLTAGAVITSLTAVFSWYRGDNINPALYVYGGVGSYTTFVVTVFPFVILLLLRTPLRRFPQNLLWLLLPLLLVAAYLTYNRMFWVALGGSALVLFALLALHSQNVRLKKAFAISIVTLLVVSAIAFYEVLARRTGPTDLPVLEQTATKDTRPLLWRFSIEKIGQHPWTGQGFGLRSFNYAYPQMTEIHPYYWHAHNIFLDYAIQMGIAGVLAFGLLVFAVCREFWLLYRGPDASLMWLGAAGLAMVTGVLLKNMTDLFFYRENSLLFWSLVGMVLGCARYQKASKARIVQTSTD